MAYIATLGDQTHRIEVQELEEDHLYRVVIDGEELVIDGRKLSGHIYSLLVNNRSFMVDVAAKEDLYTVVCEGKSFHLKLLDERRATRPGEGSSEGREGGKEVRAFMPGKVVEVLVAVGDEVSKDQGVLIVEAMKMENEVRSEAAGKIKEIRVSPGQAVESGELLVVLE
ncbi:MAG: biotin/lipoyl-binding protein [Deltaproteobacteria bacterium]|nr:biotin/lipoyl-binding protein [Deltaproteobacteria bacterium]